MAPYTHTRTTDILFLTLGLSLALLTTPRGSLAANSLSEITNWNPLADMSLALGTQGNQPFEGTPPFHNPNETRHSWDDTSTWVPSKPLPTHLIIVALSLITHISYNGYRGKITNGKLVLWAAAGIYVVINDRYPQVWITIVPPLWSIISSNAREWLSNYNYSWLTTTIALSLTVAVVAKSVQAPHAVSTPYQEPTSKVKTKDISSEYARIQPIKYFDCASAKLAQSNGGPGWNSQVSSPLSAPQSQVFERPASIFNRFFSSLLRFWKKGYCASNPPPTMEQLLRDWKPLVDSTADPDVKCMLFTILRVVEHLKRAVYRKDNLKVLAESVVRDPIRIREYEQAVIDMHLDALDPTCYLVELEESIEASDNTVFPAIEVYQIDAWEAFKHAVNIDNFDTDTVMLFRKRFDENLRQRRQAANTTHLSVDECASIKTYQDLDKLLSGQKYHNRYWRDSSTQELVPGEFLQKNSKRELRQFLQARQNDWWQADQEKRGIKTYGCPDCGDQVKEGHKCITTASEKVRIDKYGVPVREVSVAKGQAGRIRQDKMVLPDVPHMQNLIEEAQQKAAKSKVTLPPIAKQDPKHKLKEDKPNRPLLLTTPLPDTPITSSPKLATAKVSSGAKSLSKRWPPTKISPPLPAAITSDNPLLASPPRQVAATREPFIDVLDLGRAASDDSDDEQMEVTVEDDGDGALANVVTMTREEFDNISRNFWNSLQSQQDTRDF
jgi:hypothetical protein